MNEQKKPTDHGQQNLIALTFIVNGKTVTIERVNLNQPLKVAAEKALNDSGNTIRPLSDWLVKFNDKDLDLQQKVVSFNFTENSKIFMSLKSAEGGEYKRSIHGSQG